MSASNAAIAEQFAGSDWGFPPPQTHQRALTKSKITERPSVSQALSGLLGSQYFYDDQYFVKTDSWSEGWKPALGSALREESATLFDGLNSSQSPKALEWRAMEEEIEAAKYILQIENNGETDYFVPYSRTTLACATDFLRRQVIHAHSAHVVGMGVPQIGPADGGSVDLFWEKSDRTLLINFPSSGGLASYYGKKPKSEISGRFDPSESRADLVIWLAD